MGGRCQKLVKLSQADFFLWFGGNALLLFLILLRYRFNRKFYIKLNFSPSV